MVPVLVALAFLILAPFSTGAGIGIKKRILVNAEVISGTQNTPTGFTTTTPIYHRGDFRGAEVCTIEIVVTGMSGTSITPVAETSHDGTTWTPLVAFTAITTNGTYKKNAEDDFECPQRFIRIAWTIAGGGTGTATVNVYYRQVSARGGYAYPGIPDRYS